jgi:hypothetical protein
MGSHFSCPAIDFDARPVLHSTRSRCIAVIRKRRNSEQNNEGNRVSKNHIFWVVPNYRADESQAEFKPHRGEEEFSA